MSELHLTLHKDKAKSKSKLDTFTSINCDCSRPCAFKDKCYALRDLKIYHNAKDCYHRNEEIILSENYEIPIIPTFFARFFSYGDLNTLSHIKMIKDICESNPRVTFGIWLRSDMLADLKNEMEDVNYPNLTKVLSIKKYNHIPHDNDCLGYDSSFTVYTDKHLMEKDLKDGLIDIICKGKCKNCLSCYTKHDRCLKVGEPIK